MTDAVPKLRARMAPWVGRVLAHPDWLHELVESRGSPLHLLSTEPFLHNHQALQAVGEARGIDTLVLYACKANRATTFIEAAATAGAGVDTASLAELDAALRAGVPGERIVVSGAVKPESLLRRSLAVGAQVVVDNADEAAALRRLAHPGTRARTALRLTGFPLAGDRRYSRFGVPVAEARRFVAEHLPGPLAPQGLHFHLDGYSIEERGTAAHASLDLAASLAADGVEVASIDIGGGLLVDYLDDHDQWASFWQELRRALRGERDPITFDNAGLGLRLVDGVVAGEPDVYPFCSPRTGPRFLDGVLQRTDSTGRSAAQRLRTSRIQLRLEPGRALLDGCGATVARVVHRKVDGRGDLLVGLEMTGSQHGSSGADILIDPVLASRPGDAEEGGAPVGAFLTGATCTEGDLLLRRRIPLPRQPRVGDLVVFVNTAGYFMHFRATEGHRFGRAPDLVVAFGDDGRPHAHPDEHAPAPADGAPGP